MSEPRAIPDEERPFIPEEKIPAKESTDFDAEPRDDDGAVDDDAATTERRREEGVRDV